MMTETGSAKILFVDDEANILKALQRLFIEEDDYEIFTACGGAEGLEVVRENPDLALIISDQRMPEMSGVEFLAASREIAPQALRIVLTGYADIDAAMDAINKGGAYRYISKPWDDDNLRAVVREGVEKFRLIAENRRLQEELRQKNEELARWNRDLEKMVQEQSMELQQKYDESKELNRRLRDHFRRTIKAVAALIELRDKKMRSHSENVARLSMAVGKRLSLPKDEQEKLLVGSMLHDVGKIGIADVNLDVPLNDLDETGRKEYLDHPVLGQAAVAMIVAMQGAGRLIRHHHERFDGKGFPDQLAGEDIPLGARIIAAADFLDHRVREFEGDSGLDLCLKNLQDLAGSRFDPAVVPPVAAAAREVYAEILPHAEFVERELPPDRLRRGMVLARDVVAASGLLLLRKGVKLDAESIETLRSYYELDPNHRPIRVIIESL